jgi:hypothetical protein
MESSRDGLRPRTLLQAADPSQRPQRLHSRARRLDVGEGSTDGPTATVTSTPSTTATTFSPTSPSTGPPARSAPRCASTTKLPTAPPPAGAVSRSQPAWPCPAPTSSPLHANGSNGSTTSPTGPTSPEAAISWNGKFPSSSPTIYIASSTPTDKTQEASTSNPARPSQLRRPTTVSHQMLIDPAKTPPRGSPDEGARCGRRG